MDSSPNRCEGKVMRRRTGEQRHCPSPAKRQYETAGDAVQVCQKHFEMLARNAERRSDSDEELVRIWKSSP